MKKFLLADSTQAWICTILGVYIIAGIVFLFITPNSTLIAFPVSVLVAIITVLVYNVWVSLTLNSHEKSR